MNITNIAQYAAWGIILVFVIIAFVIFFGVYSNNKKNTPKKIKVKKVKEASFSSIGKKHALVIDKGDRQKNDNAQLAQNLFTNKNIPAQNTPQGFAPKAGSGSLENIAKGIGKENMVDPFKAPLPEINIIPPVASPTLNSSHVEQVFVKEPEVTQTYTSPPVFKPPVLAPLETALIQDVKLLNNDDESPISAELIVAPILLPSTVAKSPNPMPLLGPPPKIVGNKTPQKIMPYGNSAPVTPQKSTFLLPPADKTKD